MAPVGGSGSHFKSKRSLDSDEENNKDEGSRKYDMLASGGVGGQEAATLPSEESVWIPPFNLLEEVEGRHFDTDGNYFLNQDT